MKPRIIRCLPLAVTGLLLLVCCGKDGVESSREGAACDPCGEDADPMRLFQGVQSTCESGTVCVAATFSLQPFGPGVCVRRAGSTTCEGTITDSNGTRSNECTYTAKGTGFDVFCQPAPMPPASSPTAPPSPAPSPSPTPTPLSCEDFVEQPSYAGDCGARPKDSVCLRFSDGYLWLVTDAVDGWEDHSCSGSGRSGRDRARFPRVLSPSRRHTARQDCPSVVAGSHHGGVIRAVQVLAAGAFEC